MHHSFTYSLPVTSKNIVNKVDIEYYDFIKDDKVDDIEDDKYKIKKEDLFITDGNICFMIKFKKLYDRINELSTDDINFNSKLEVIETNFAFALYKIKNYSEIEFGDEKTFTVFKVIDKDNTSLNYEKRNYLISNDISILKNGVKEYSHTANHLITKKTA